jgi:hypothetical protein
MFRQKMYVTKITQSKPKAILLMEQLKTIIKQAQFLALGLGLAILSAGCTSEMVTRTVGLPGLTPLASADQVKLVEEGKPVSQPYQLVGAVTVARTASIKGEEKPPPKYFSYQRMKEVAAAMGADGVIGVHLGLAQSFYGPYANCSTAERSGLAVKWLMPGEAQRPVKKPFVVALLPMAKDSKAQDEPVMATALGKHPPTSSNMPPAEDKQADWTATIGSAVVEPLELKGYYVLPSTDVTYQGGLEGARNLGDTELQSLGGNDAHLLLEAANLGKVNANIVVGAAAAVQIKTTLMDKTTRKDIFQGTGTGELYLGWLLNMLSDKDRIAAGIGAYNSLKTIEPINEKVEEK